MESNTQINILEQLIELKKWHLSIPLSLHNYPNLVSYGALRFEDNFWLHEWIYYAKSNLNTSVRICYQAFYTTAGMFLAEKERKLFRPLRHL